LTLRVEGDILRSAVNAKCRKKLTKQCHLISYDKWLYMITWITKAQKRFNISACTHLVYMKCLMHVENIMTLDGGIM